LDSDNQNKEEESEEDEELSSEELNSYEDEALETEDEEDELHENTEKQEVIVGNKKVVNDETEVRGLNFKISLLQKFT